MIPFIRNHGGSFYAMMSMVAGFITNIILDWLFVWIFHQGVAGAAIATIIGQGVTFLTALIYMLRYKQFTLNIPVSNIVLSRKLNDALSSRLFYAHFDSHRDISHFQKQLFLRIVFLREKHPQINCGCLFSQECCR